MPSLGIQDLRGQLVTTQVELPDSIDGIVDKVREIILLGSVQRITIANEQPIVYQRYVDPADVSAEEDSTASFLELRLMDVIRNLDNMTEFSLVEQGLDKSCSQEVFFWMLYFVEHAGWTPTHLLLSEDSGFWKWLGIGNKRGKSLTRFMGMRIERDKMLPSEVFLICGASHRAAAISEIGFVLKGNVR